MTSQHQLENGQEPIAPWLRSTLGALGGGFALIGVAWIVAPAQAASGMGMPLLEGDGLSTQVGDLAAFFLTLGICMMTGVRTGQRIWFIPALLLLALAAAGRIIAWLVHGAAVPVPVAVELPVALLLWGALRGAGRGANA